MVLPVSRPKSTIRSSHFYFWSHCSNSSFTSCWCLRSWPRINGSSWLPTVLSAVWRGQRCLAELMNSEGLPAGKAFALEGNDALCIPHPTECWMRQIQALPNMEKRGERKTFPDSSLQIHDTTCRSTAPFYPQALTGGKEDVTFSSLWAPRLAWQLVPMSKGHSPAPQRHASLSAALDGFSKPCLSSIHWSELSWWWIKNERMFLHFPCLLVTKQELKFPTESIKKAKIVTWGGYIYWQELFDKWSQTWIELCGDHCHVNVKVEIALKECSLSLARHTACPT